MLRLGMFTMDVALMTFGPSYQISLNSLLLTDKSHTSSIGQYLDLIHTPIRSKEDVLVLLFRRVSYLRILLGLINIVFTKIAFTAKS